MSEQNAPTMGDKLWREFAKEIIGPHLYEGFMISDNYDKMRSKWEIKIKDASPAPEVAQHNTVKDMQEVFPGKQPEAISTNTAEVAATSDHDVCQNCGYRYEEHEVGNDVNRTNLLSCNSFKAPVSEVATPTGGSEAKRFLEDMIAKDKTLFAGVPLFAVDAICKAMEEYASAHILHAACTVSAVRYKAEGELAALKALAGKVSPAYSQLQFFQDGYRNGSASISEVMRAGDDFHKTLDELSAALGEKTDH